MKKSAILLPMLIMAACSGSGPSKDGENQLSQPAQNSGPTTETERAIKAGQDSASVYNTADSLLSDTMKK